MEKRKSNEFASERKNGPFLSFNKFVVAVFPFTL